jgi:hypothetical protein
VKTSAPKESAFVERRRKDWDELESLVHRAPRGLRKIEPLAIARVGRP